MTIDQLQARVDRLERRQAWTLDMRGRCRCRPRRRDAHGAGTDTAGRPAWRARASLKGSSFELVDAEGRIRAVLRLDKGAPVMQFHDAFGTVALRLSVRGSDGSIEYADDGEMLSLMKPAPRVNPLTSR